MQQVQHGSQDAANNAQGVPAKATRRGDATVLVSQWGLRNEDRRVDSRVAQSYEGSVGLGSVKR